MKVSRPPRIHVHTSRGMSGSPWEIWLCKQRRVINQSQDYFNQTKKDVWFIWCKSKWKQLNTRHRSGDTKMHKVSIKDLREILEKQKHCCALTGEPLTPEIAVVDHIQALTKDGLNHKDNIQVVTTKINKAKGTLSNEEFITLCKSVVKHAR